MNVSPCVIFGWALRKEDYNITAIIIRLRKVHASRNPKARRKCRSNSCGGIPPPQLACPAFVGKQNTYASIRSTLPQEIPGLCLLTFQQMWPFPGKGLGDRANI